MNINDEREASGAAGAARRAGDDRMTRYERPLQLAIEAAKRAGAILREDFHRTGGPRGSGGHAEADVAADVAIRDALAETGWGYRSEEVSPGGRARDSHLWLVDPNDGTSAYLEGRRGSAVSIALLRGGVPVLGVVYAFAYPDDAGDLVTWAEGCGPMRRNGTGVSRSLAGRRIKVGETVLVSHAADRASEANAVLVHPARFRALPSIAYRLAVVAVGEAVAAVSLNGPCGWDYAGGHALVCASGGELLDERGKPVTYGPDGESQTSACFGGAPAAVAVLAKKSWQAVLHGRREQSPLARLAPGHAVPDLSRLRRAQGCLAGQLAGDALGGLVEFRGPRDIASQYPDGVRELADGGTWNTLAGQPTDDSEMALTLARTLVETGTFDQGLVRGAYQTWMRSGPFDSGGTTQNALLGSTTDALDTYLARVARRNADSKANGSVMRASVLGIASTGRPLEAADWARRDSALTHPNPVCVAASAAFVAGVATAIDTGDASACLAAARAAANGQAEVLDALSRAEASPPDDFMSHAGLVTIAIQNAFYQVLHAPTLEDGVVDTIMRGGDTDTNGAIAGALLGALYGRDAIPAQWLTAILCCRPAAAGGAGHPRPKEYWPVDVLELAERLLLLAA